MPDGDGCTSVTGSRGCGVVPSAAGLPTVMPRVSAGRPTNEVVLHRGYLGGGLRQKRGGPPRGLPVLGGGRSVSARCYRFGECF